MNEQQLLKDISNVTDDVNAIMRAKQEIAKLHFTQLNLGDEIEIALFQMRKNLALLQKELAIIQVR